MTDRNQNWQLQTQLVRGGLHRSPHGETSEALFLNSGFVYDSAEQSEARFKGEDDGFIYSRYGNPTVTMFEERLALLEGAEVCFATASGMAAVHAALACQVRAGDRVVASRALFGSCHVVLRRNPAALRGRNRARRRPGSETMGGSAGARRPMRVFRDPGQSNVGVDRHCRGQRIGPRSRRLRRHRQCLLDTAAAAPAALGRGRGDLFRHQAY